MGLMDSVTSNGDILGSSDGLWDSLRSSGFLWTSHALKECLSNIEMPDEALSSHIYSSNKNG